MSYFKFVDGYTSEPRYDRYFERDLLLVLRVISCAILWRVVRGHICTKKLGTGAWNYCEWNPHRFHLCAFVDHTNNASKLNIELLQYPNMHSCVNDRTTDRAGRAPTRPICDTRPMGGWASFSFFCSGRVGGRRLKIHAGPGGWAVGFSTGRPWASPGFLKFYREPI